MAVPRFEPFLGIRYDLSRSGPELVTAPPYDVITEAERADLVERSPHNAVLIDLPVEADGPTRYETAGHRLAGWQQDGTLVVDPRPSFTVYRMSYTDDLGRSATTLGVIGALGLSAPGEGGILPHEFTTPKARSDRLDLLRGTRANLSAIWGLSLTPGLTELLAVDGPPLASWTDEDEVAHTVWRIDDPDRVEAISAAVAASPVVIADGHHRYETSLAYRDERRAEALADVEDASAPEPLTGDEALGLGTEPAPEEPVEGEYDDNDEYPDDEYDDEYDDDEDDEEGRPSADADLVGDAGAAEATMCFVVELVEEQLTVRPIHRLLNGVPPRTDLAEVLEPWFIPGATVEAYAVEKGSVLGRMAAARAIGLIRPDGSARLLTPRAEAFEGVADLDSARLAHALAASSLAGEPIEVTYQHGVENIVDAVADGDADAGFLLRPATVAQIAANAHAGDRMPPKTTFFHPKPKTGIVFRSLD
jgi:uncharacterized protein (DUF1015 family)